MPDAGYDLYRLYLPRLAFFIGRLTPESGHKVLGLDVVFDPVGGAIEPPLAPAGQAEDGFPQRFRRDGAGMNRHTADMPPFSITSTDMPPLAAWMAARWPAGPLPITMASCRVMAVMLQCNVDPRKAGGGQTPANPLHRPTG